VAGLWRLGKADDWVGTCGLCELCKRFSFSHLRQLTEVLQRGWGRVRPISRGHCAVPVAAAL
jgi:hypothetical protein